MRRDTFCAPLWVRLPWSGERRFELYRRLDLDVSAQEIQERLQRWRPPKMNLHGWMERHQAQVTSGNTGAVLTPDD